MRLAKNRTFGPGLSAAVRHLHASPTRTCPAICGMLAAHEEDALLVRPSGREAIRAYIDEQAQLGARNAAALARAEWDRIAAAASGLDGSLADRAPAADEWSAAQVLEHILLSLQRNRERLDVLYRGEPYTGPVQTAGQLPEQPQASFSALRDAFVAEAAALYDFLMAADSARNLQGTAGHAAFGDLNWLQWASYLHLHARDHADQIEAIRAAVGAK